MVADISVTKHAVAFPSKVLAAEGGKHIYNIQLTADCDNGNFVKKGDWLDLDLYEEAAATSFEGIVRAKAANGNWYVEVVTPGDALFVCNVDDHAEDWTNKFRQESIAYNKAGSVVRGYELAVGDIVEISDAGFTAVPVLVAGTDYEVELSGKKLAKA